MEILNVIEQAEEKARQYAYGNDSEMIKSHCRRFLKDVEYLRDNIIEHDIHDEDGYQIQMAENFFNVFNMLATQELGL